MNSSNVPNCMYMLNLMMIMWLENTKSAYKVVFVKYLKDCVQMWKLIVCSIYSTYKFQERSEHAKCLACAHMYDKQRFLTCVWVLQDFS